LLVLFGLAAWFLTRGAGPAGSQGLSGSGTVQAEEYVVAPQLAGRVIELSADEGDQVRAGQVLAQLDATLLAAQLDQANAGIAAATANLAKLQGGTRPEEVRQAEAALAQARARRDGARIALADAETLKGTQPDLNLRIDVARAVLQAADHRARAANLLAQAASKERDYFQRTLAELENPLTVGIRNPSGVVVRTLNITVRTEELRTQLAMASSKEWSAWTGQSTALAQRDGAQADLANLLAQQADPLVLAAQVDAARTQLAAAEAAVPLAQAKLDALTAGSRAENITAARAQLAQAQAARDSIKAQLTRMTLTAPADGLIDQRLLHLGEMAAPGNAVFHLVNLNSVTLTIYVPENRIAMVQSGARADVTVDSFPERIFPGRVSFISPQAEFTPKNIGTQEQRQTQVFAVKIRIDNPDQALKPGMPADAIIR
jgi:multidrug resistance efflux pump